MKNTKLWFGLILIAGLMSCSRSLVRSDYDREINFANLHTFDWTTQSEEASSKDVQKNTLFEKRLKNAVDRELTYQGFQRQTAEQPDFLIAYSIQVKDQVDVSSSGYGYSPGYYSGYYGFPHRGRHHGFGFRSGYYGFGYGSGFYGRGGGVSVHEYKEATLVLDFLDPESHDVIWRGLYKDEVDESGIIAEDKVNKAVKKILEKFPPMIA